jgi:hypothetical protein
MSKLISIQEFKEGQTLTRPIKNLFGQVLIAENVRLEEQHKIILMTWGINEFYINEDPEDEIIQNEDEILKIKKEFNERVKWEPRNHHEKELLRLALEELLKKTDKN